MRLSCVALFLSLAALPVCAQRQTIVVSGGTPEGALIQQIREESDDTKKVALMDDFLARYPKHEGVPWVYSEMTAACVKLGQYDKAMAAAEKVLAVDPGDLGLALAAVKAAEAKKDADAVRQWAVRSSDLARKEAQRPKAQDENDETLKQRVDFAKQVDTYSEYALYATALQEPQPARKAALLKTLEERAPQSQYMSQSYSVYFLALVQSGDMPAAVAVAEKLIAKGQGTEEMLAAAGDFYLRQNTEPQKVLDYSAKLVEMVNAKPKPDGVADADWDKRKNYFLGMGNWMMGALYSSQNKFAEADKVLRTALPFLESDDQTRAGALYNLGLVNQRLKKAAEAIKFYELCVAIQSPYQPLAAANLKGLKSAYKVIQ